MWIFWLFFGYLINKMDFMSDQIKNSTFKELLISQNPGGFSLVESQNLSIF